MRFRLLFKPFFRVDDSRGTTTGGMGLGLAIVRNAVTVHGGTVTARNVTPHGLEVEFRLPIVSASSTLAPDFPTRSAISGQALISSFESVGQIERSRSLAAWFRGHLD